MADAPPAKVLEAVRRVEAAYFILDGNDPEQRPHITEILTARDMKRVAGIPAAKLRSVFPHFVSGRRGGLCFYATPRIPENPQRAEKCRAPGLPCAVPGCSGRPLDGGLCIGHCWQKGYVVRDAGEKGRGLFALRKLPKGAVVGDFVGLPVEPADLEKMENARREYLLKEAKDKGVPNPRIPRRLYEECNSLTQPDGRLVYGGSSRSCQVRFVNVADKGKKAAPANARIADLGRDGMSIRLAAPVEKSMEILLDAYN